MVNIMHVKHVRAKNHETECRVVITINTQCVLHIKMFHGFQPQ